MATGILKLRLGPQLEPPKLALLDVSMAFVHLQDMDCPSKPVCMHQEAGTHALPAAGALASWSLALVYRGLI